MAGQYHGKDNEMSTLTLNTNLTFTIENVSSNDRRKETEMSDKVLMFVPLQKQPTRTEVGWWIYDKEILTALQMVDRIEQEMDLPSGVVNIENGVWGLMVDAWKVTL